jgi:hypothetical protein
MADSPFIVPVVLFVCCAVAAIGVPIARAYARRLDGRPNDPTLPPELTGRLERMEQALDSIAIEVERISEAQRFTTKLLADRNNQPVAGVPERNG